MNDVGTVIVDVLDDGWEILCEQLRLLELQYGTEAVAKELGKYPTFTMREFYDHYRDVNGLEDIA